jgi:hypothetical protein
MQKNKTGTFITLGILAVICLYFIFDFRTERAFSAQSSQSGNPANYNTTPATRTNGDASALEVDNKGNLRVTEEASYSAISTSTLIKTGVGKVMGFFVSNSGGQVTLYDSLTASGTSIITTVTPSSSGAFNFPVAVEFSTGLYARVIGTLNLTIFYK